MQSLYLCSRFSDFPNRGIISQSYIFEESKAREWFLQQYQVYDLPLDQLSTEDNGQPVMIYIYPDEVSYCDEDDGIEFHFQISPIVPDLCHDMK